MTRDEAIELLELMKRQQHEEDSAARLDPEMLARRYVRIISRRRGNGRDGKGEGGPVGGGCKPA